MKKKIFISVLSLMVAASMMIGSVSIAFADTASTYKSCLDKATTYIGTEFSKSPIYGNEWQAFVAGRSDKATTAASNAYYLNYGTKLADEGGVLRRDSLYVEYERGIIALVAVGKDPTDVGGYNLVSKLKNISKVTSQGVNCPAYGLIALNSRNFGSEYEEAKKAYVKSLVDQYQLKTGGWAFGESASTSGTADVDMTSMVLQALAPYYNVAGYESTTAAINKGLDILAQKQLSSGGFQSGTKENAESLSQVIVALTSLGLNPASTTAQTTKSGKSITFNYNMIDQLCTYQLSNGQFEHIKGSGGNGLATVQSTYALIAYDRFLGGKTSLYNMTDKGTLSTIAPVPMAWTKCALSKTSYTYNGSKPSVTVTYGGKTLTSGYSVSYSQSPTSGGTHTVTVTGDGTKFSGSVKLTYKVNKANQKLTASKSTWKKTYGNKAFYLGVKRSGNGKVTYKSSNTKIVKVSSKGKVTIVGTGKATITVTAAATTNYNKATKSIKITVAPKKETIKSLKKQTKAFTVKWSKDTKATGYQVQYARNSKFTKSKKTVTIGKNKTYSKKISKLSKKKTYYVRVRSYKSVGKTKIYGQWSKVKKVITK